MTELGTRQRNTLLGLRQYRADGRDTMRLYVPVMFRMEAEQMGRVRLKVLDVTGLLKRYYAVGDERPVSEVLSGKKSRSYVARLSAVERELQARWNRIRDMNELAAPDRDALLAAIHRATLSMKRATAEGAFEIAMARLGRLLRERQLERRCNPNWSSQPRVPRHHFDGGQWTDGAGSVGEQLQPLEFEEPVSGANLPVDQLPNEELFRDDYLLLAAEQITGFTGHGIDQAVTRGVAPSAILDAVANPIRIRQMSNGTTRYIGSGAVVVLNPAGSVVTVWRK